MRSKGLNLKLTFLTFETSEIYKESGYLQNIKIIESLQRLDSKQKRHIYPQKVIHKHESDLL